MAQELNVDLMIARSIAISAETPENKAVVEDVIRAVNTVLLEKHPPNWAVATALTFILGDVGNMLLEQVVSQVEAAQRSQQHGDN